MIITIDLKEHDSSLKKKLTYTFNPGHYHHHQTIIGIKQSSIMSHFRAKNLTTSAYIYLKFILFSFLTVQCVCVFLSIFFSMFNGFKNSVFCWMKIFLSHIYTAISRKNK